MADEAFALSPIDARAAQPTDADYDAICAAFMETTRGRWFLDEYARRNRNADTRLVLDAVARLQANLESQRQAPAAEAARPAADPWPELAKMLAKARVEIAQHLLREGRDAGLETIRAGAETIRSVSWALRERGFDSRICDAFDTRVATVLEGHAALSAAMAADAAGAAHVLGAVDHLIEAARRLLNDQAEPRNDETLLDEVVDAVAGAMADESAFAESGAFDGDDIEPPGAAGGEDDAGPRAAAPDGFIEIRGVDEDLDIVDIPAAEPPAPTLSEPELNRRRLHEAKIALHGAPAGDAAIGHAAVGSAAVEGAPDGHSSNGPASNGSVLAEDSAPAASGRTMSLGHAALASGAIARPAIARPDPLAPFRRMSQAEKIAFFT